MGVKSDEYGADTAAGQRLVNDLVGLSRELDKVGKVQNNASISSQKSSGC